MEKLKTRYIVVTFVTDGVVSTIVRSPCWHVRLQHFVRLDERKRKSNFINGAANKDALPLDSNCFCE